MRENVDQNNSEYGHILRSVNLLNDLLLDSAFHTINDINTEHCDLGLHLNASQKSAVFKNQPKI